MTTRIVAKIEQCMYEPGCMAAVYVSGSGKLIHMLPQVEPGLPTQVYDSRQQASEHIQECFPGAEIVEEEAFEQAYRAEGYHYPGRLSTFTNLLCRCGGWLRINNGDQFVSQAPYNSYRSVGYHCEQCPRVYLASRNSEAGPRTWWYKPESDFINPDTETGYLYCESDDPRDHQSQPFGFGETRLGIHSLEDEEK